MKLERIGIAAVALVLIGFGAVHIASIPKQAEGQKAMTMTVIPDPVEQKTKPQAETKQSAPASNDDTTPAEAPQSEPATSQDTPAPTPAPVDEGPEIPVYSQTVHTNEVHDSYYKPPAGQNWVVTL